MGQVGFRKGRGDRVARRAQVRTLGTDGVASSPALPPPRPLL